MKKTNLFKSFTAAVLVTIAFAANAQSIEAAESYGYSVYQSANTSSTDCINIKFSLKNDCYAKMYVIQSDSAEKIMLVEGDISTGLHGVMFKTGKNDSKTYKCILEAYDVNSGELIHTSETNISQK
ncbi:MAG: hypothetical protein K8I03_10035 [Ignavibacteria bacterium]|nr:hypothetical protein [Ignavibacteria bacterium]